MLAVELADVLSEVPAVGVPGAVLLDSQRAGGGGRDTGGILLRECNATDRHRLGGDGRTRSRTVLHSFRASTIHRPLRGSQATFADKNRFRLQRGRKLRNKSFLYTDERLAGGIVARGSGDTVHTILQRFRTERSFGNGGILRRRLLCQGESLFHHIAHGVVLQLTIIFRIIAAPCNSRSSTDIAPVVLKQEREALSCSKSTLIASIPNYASFLPAPSLRISGSRYYPTPLGGLSRAMRENMKDAQI